MTTTLAIDGVLLERARRIGNLRTKKETVTQALTELSSAGGNERF